VSELLLLLLLPLLLLQCPVYSSKQQGVTTLQRDSFVLSCIDIGSPSTTRQ
jgi:hypothetical protein